MEDFHEADDAAPQDRVGVRVRSVELFERTTEVFDIQVEVDHSFIVADVVVHNSLICSSLDGRIWAVDDPNIDVPPRHFSCRSVLVPILDWKGLGIDPPDEGTRAARDPRTGKVTQIKASTTYQDWLKKLGETPEGIIEQNKILGPGRAKLFRDGKIDLRDLVRKDHSIIKLDDLQKKAS